MFSWVLWSERSKASRLDRKQIRGVSTIALIGDRFVDHSMFAHSCVPLYEQMTELGNKMFPHAPISAVFRPGLREVRFLACDYLRNREGLRHFTCMTRCAISRRLAHSFPMSQRAASEAAKSQK